MSAHGTSSPRSAVQRRIVWVAAIVGALCLGVLPAATSAAGPIARFTANYNDCSVYGVAAPNRTIKVTWKDSDGSLKHVQTVTSKANGTFRTTCDDDELVERGDTFTAKIGTTSRSFTVPRLGFWIDRDSDQIQGKTLSSTTVRVAWPTGVAEVNTESDGSFSYDASGDTDLIGSDWVKVSFESTAGDLVLRWLQVPFVTVFRGRAGIFLRGRPGATIEAQLLDGSTTRAEVDCRVGTSGGCSLSFIDEDGHLVPARAGDRVVSTDIGADFIIPEVTVKGAIGTDVISGTCLAGTSSPFYVEAYRPSGPGFASRSGTTTASGTFSRDITSSMDLRSGDKIYAECQLPSGDWVARFITVP